MAAAIRPRGPAESVDLGFRMVRAWWRPVYGAWTVSVLPVAIAAAAAALDRWPAQLFLALWWLRPLFDRVPLFVLSRCLFGDRPRARDVLRALPRLWGRQLGALTWRRFDPARSYRLPVWQLEGLSGRRRRERLRSLSTGRRAQGFGITLACLCLEAALFGAQAGLLVLMLPEGAVRNAMFGANGIEMPHWARAIWLAMALLSFSIVEPLYVAAGFALYLGERTRQEGWDVEIALRRLQERLAALPQTAGPPAVLALTLALGSFAVAAVPAAAAEAAAADADATGDEAAATIARVLSDPVFQTLDQEVEWQDRVADKQGAIEAPDLSWLLPFNPQRWLGSVGGVSGASLLLRGLGIVVLVALVAALLLRHRWLPYVARGTGGDRAAARDAKPVAETIAGLDVRAASLPGDVPSAAWRLWESAGAAAALGLLYRAALATLIHDHGYRFAESWTEGDCLGEVRRTAATAATVAAATAPPAGLVPYFARLTAVWQEVAYGHRQPAAAVAWELCEGFRQLPRPAAGKAWRGRAA